MCAVLAFDQAGIDRCQERRIVQGHGHLGESGLAGLLPRCADVVASRLQAVVGSGLVVDLDLDLDVQGQGAELAGEAVFFCGEGADGSHGISPFGLNKVAPIASLL